MKSFYESKERLIAVLFMAGGACFIGGLFILFGGMLFRTGILFMLGVLLMPISLTLVGGAIYLGMSHNRSMTMGRERPQEEARVIARFAINQIGEMIFDNYDYDAEDARFYVKVQYLDGKREEFECARPVFDQAGEGMRGLLTMHGGWLTMFTPLIDTEETRAAYREF